MGSTLKQDPEQVSPQRKAGIGFLIGIRGGTEKQKTRKPEWPPHAWWVSECRKGSSNWTWSLAFCGRGFLRAVLSGHVTNLALLHLLEKCPVAQSHQLWSWLPSLPFPVPLPALTQPGAAPGFPKTTHHPVLSPSLLPVKGRRMDLDLPSAELF